MPATPEKGWLYSRVESLCAADIGEPQREPEWPHHGQHEFGTFCRNQRASSAEAKPGITENHFDPKDDSTSVTYFTFGRLISRKQQDGSPITNVRNASGEQLNDKMKNRKEDRMQRVGNPTKYSNYSPPFWT